MKITLADLESWLAIHLAGNERAVAEAIIEAVNVTVTKWHGAPDTWEKRFHTGAVMLAAHLWHRRGTPGGVTAFGDEGRMYVQKHDPQAAMLLGLGGWTIPRVG